MSRYMLKWTCRGKDRSAIRHAENAQEACYKLAYQYGWQFDLDLVDADTRGKEWARGTIDRYTLPYCKILDADLIKD